MHHEYESPLPKDVKYIGLISLIKGIKRASLFIPDHYISSAYFDNIQENFFMIEVSPKYTDNLELLYDDITHALNRYGVKTKKIEFFRKKEIGAEEKRRNKEEWDVYRLNGLPVYVFNHRIIEKDYVADEYKDWNDVLLVNDYHRLKSMYPEKYWDVAITDF